MGSAGARLVWRGRTLAGRVIHEYLAVPGFNRITRVYRGLWRDFAALYLALEDGSDLYVHAQESPELGELTGTALGFVVRGREARVLEPLRLETCRTRCAPGFYRWPVAWHGRFERGSCVLEVEDLEVVSSWITGGFALGAVGGTVTLDGQRLRARGVAELLQ